MLGLSHRRLDWDTDGRDWPNRPASRFVECDGMRWHVQIMGRKDAPALLLVHGTGAASHSFRDLMPLLAADFRVITPDLPGHGFSDTPDRDGLSLWGMSVGLAHLLDALAVAPVAGIGHSAGAAILLHMALTARADFRRIVGLNAALEPITGNTVFSPLAKMLFMNPFVPRMLSFRAHLSDITGFMLSSTGSQIDEAGKNLYRALVKNPAHVNGALGMMANWDLAPVQMRLRHLKVPLSLVVAENDRTVPPGVSRRAAAKAPDAEIVSYARGGHLLHEVEPQMIAELVVRRLAA